MSCSVSLCVGSGWRYSHLTHFLCSTSCSRSLPTQPLITPSPGLLLRRLAGPGKQAGREQTHTPEDGAGRASGLAAGGSPVEALPICLAPSFSPSYLHFPSSFPVFCPRLSCLPAAPPSRATSRRDFGCSCCRWSLLGEPPFPGASGDMRGLGLGWGELREDFGKSSQG